MFVAGMMDFTMAIFQALTIVRNPSGNIMFLDSQPNLGKENEIANSILIQTWGDLPLLSLQIWRDTDPDPSEWRILQLVSECFRLHRISRTPSPGKWITTHMVFTDIWRLGGQNLEEVPRAEALVVGCRKRSRTTT